jgi:ABC-type glycerol-3-phosphate transport system substrate-binding protein
MKTLVLLLTVMAAALPLAPADAEEVTLRVTIPTALKLFRIGTDQFNEQYKGKYRAELDMIPLESMVEKQMTHFMSRSDAYDVHGIHSSWMNTAARNLVPLNPYVSKHGPDLGMYGTGTMNSVSVKGNILGLPVRGPGTNILYYRKDLFEAAGLKPPLTPDDVLNAARKLTVKGADGQVQRYGYSFMAGAPYWSVVTLADLLFPRGVYFMTEDYQDANPELKGPVAVAALNYLKRFVDEGLVPNPLAWGSDENLVAIKEGRIAMSMESSGKVGFVEVEKESKVAGKMGYMPAPIPKGGQYPPRMFGFVWMFSIDRNSKKMDGAYEYIKYMASEKAQRAMAIEAGNDPSVRGVLESAEYRKTNPGAPAVMKIRYEIGTRTPMAVPENPQLSKAVHEELHAFLLGKQDASASLGRMYDRIRTIIKKA